MSNTGKWWCNKISHSKILFRLQPWHVSTYAQKTPRNKTSVSKTPKLSISETPKLSISETPKLFRVHSTWNEILFPLHLKQNSVSIPLKTKFFFQITLLYKPQHTSVVQWYPSMCQPLDLVLAACHCDMTLAVHLTLLSNCLVGLLANTDHIMLGFCTASSAHDVIS